MVLNNGQAQVEAVVITIIDDTLSGFELTQIFVKHFPCSGLMVSSGISSSSVHSMSLQKTLVGEMHSYCCCGNLIVANKLDTLNVKRI